MIKRFICFFIFIITAAVYAQNYDKHKVNAGETIAQIAQKYNVTTHDIYMLNPDAQHGLKPNSVLLIPKKGDIKKTNFQVKTHKVAPKETLFSIENQYGITDQDLKKANLDLLKNGLQTGQVLVIPFSTKLKSVQATADKVIYHEVLVKETKYSIAKQYGITVEELEKINPEITTSLSVGQKIVVKGTAPKKLSIPTQKETVKTVAPKANYIAYVIKPQETMFSLSKMSGLSQEELLLLNPVLANGVEIGMEIRVPEYSAIYKEVEEKKTYTIVSKNANDRKKLVLLLPFNLSKIEGDTVNSTSTRLKKDKFLNMTLDFYSGALMAIDSARSIGIPVDISVFDSQETKNSSNILTINQQNNLETADAIIGPFYQNNVEKTAALLSDKNVAIISPLSKDVGNSFANLYQTIPTTVALKRAIFDYMISKGGNIIAIVDKKKESARQFILQNYPEVKFAALFEDGSLSAESLKSLLVKGKMNYVLLASENTGIIKWTMSTMMSVMVNYQVELVIMEPNETLDTDEINFENLTKLKLMYPSTCRENQSAGALIFKKQYRQINKIMPSSYAIRGFDITFDTMIRLAQGNTYQESVDSVATEQVDNRFEFYKKADKGYTNKGIYILYYDTDLLIKEAN
jgi:LysM repeat protein